MFATICSFTKNDPLCMTYHPYHFVGKVLLHPVYKILRACIVSMNTHIMKWQIKILVRKICRPPKVAFRTMTNVGPCLNAALDIGACNFKSGVLNVSALGLKADYFRSIFFAVLQDSSQSLYSSISQTLLLRDPP